MSAWDRRDALMKYEALLDEAEDMEEAIATLGSPTKLAIGLALNYVPSPAPEVLPVEDIAVETPDEPAMETAPAEEAIVEAEEAPPVEEKEAEEEPAPTLPAKPKRRVRAFGLIGSILFGLIIGLPVALVLICLGIPFLVTGLGIIGADLWAVISLIPMLAMISDILVVAGVGLVIAAFGLLLAWFGLWVSFELGYLWISGVVLRLGRALTYKKEVASNE